MGVKGLTTLLTDDPRRFGDPWSLGAPGEEPVKDGDASSKLTTAAAAIVYIDGPALLHHLLAAASSLYGPTNSTGGNATGPSISLAGPSAAASSASTGQHSAQRSVPHIPNLPPSLLGQISPAAIYTLAHTFTSALHAAGATEVHLVLDGLASEYKTQTQVERLADASRRADLTARRLLCGDGGGGGGGGRPNGAAAAPSWGAWDVPHLFAERAMEEAFRDLQQQSTCAEAEIEEGLGPFRTHRGRGEAEGCIARLIEERCCNSNSSREEEKGKERGEEEIVILSNDTDFLVYPSCPGFVPLRSLQFLQLIPRGSSSQATHVHPTNTNGVRAPYRITGWRFGRDKFQSAYPKLFPNNNSGTTDNRDDNLTAMTMVSALCGNDYNLLPRKYDDALRYARTVIVRSDIGGLRQRERNAPTARGGVVAVLRYVGHYRGRVSKRREAEPRLVRQGRDAKRGNKQAGHDKQQQQDKEEDKRYDWLRRLSNAVVGNGEKKGRRDHHARAAADDLFKALLLVRDVYSRDAATASSVARFAVAGVSNADVEVDGVDARRLIERDEFFCRPVVETWDNGGGFSKPGGWQERRQRVVNTRKNQRAGRKKSKKTKRMKKAKKGQRGGAAEQQFPSGGLMEEGAGEEGSGGVYPLAAVDAFENLGNDDGRGSVWMVPRFVVVRKRLYRIVSWLISSNSFGIVDASLASKPAVSSGVVREYCRAGTGDQIEYKEVMVDVDVRHPSSTTGSGCPCPDLDVIMCSCPTGNPPTTEEARGKAFYASLEYSLFGNGCTIKAAHSAAAYSNLGFLAQSLASLPPSLRHICLAGTLLQSERDALALFITSTSPTLNPDPFLEEVKYYDPGRSQTRSSALFCGYTSREVVQSAGRIQVACHQAEVVVNVLTYCLRGETFIKDLDVLVNIRASITFRDDIFALVWHAVQECADMDELELAESPKGEEERDDGGGFELFDVVFDALQCLVCTSELCSATVEYFRGEEVRNRWRDSAVALWKQHVAIADMYCGNKPKY